MRISHRHRFVFFSNPKTGSESVRSLLDPYCDVPIVPFWELNDATPFYPHMRPVEAREVFSRLGWDFDRYFKFTFVRNPWARLVSLYTMIYGSPSTGIRGRLGAARRRLVRGHPGPAGFRQWVRAIATSGRGGGGPADQRWRMYGTYSLRSYASDPEGRELVDRVLRLEDIADALPGTLRDIGLPTDKLSIPRVNQRNRPDSSTYYDRRTMEYVARLYAEDIARFGYRFSP